MDTPLSESRYAGILEGWVDEERETHDHEDDVIKYLDELDDHDHDNEPFEEEDHHDNEEDDDNDDHSDEDNESNQVDDTANDSEEKVCISYF